MVSVVVAVLSAVGGVLAGLVPALLVSERRRLLHFMEEETKVIGVVEDSEAKDNLTRGLRATTKRYELLATQTRVEKLRRRLVLAFYPLYLWSLVAGMVIAAGYLGDYPDSQFRWFLGVGGSMLLVGIAAFAFMLSRYFDAKREARREESTVVIQQEQINELQAKIARFVIRAEKSGGAEVF